MATPTNDDNPPHSLGGDDVETSTAFVVESGSDDSVETSTATAFVVENSADIEEGTPVIELPAASEAIGETSENCGSVAEAIVVNPDSGVHISVEDLESTPIAHHVQPQESSPSLESGGGQETSSQENFSLERRAEFISATVLKSSPETPVGLGLVCNKENEVLVSSIAPGTLAANTPFRAGDRMLSVNAKRCYVMDAQDVAKFLAAQVGRVTIVVHNEGGDPNLVESMVTKPDPTSRCGLGLHSSGRRNLKVSNIESDGLFFDSLLNSGDPLVSINGQDCTAVDARDAGGMIARAGNYITIKARTSLETGVVVAAFSCNNSTGSTIPPQIMNAINKVQSDDMLPSTQQLAFLMLAAIFMIAFLLLSGIM